jgi:hypothetical protein
MENHHYGWMPSFLDLFAKNAFTDHGLSNADMLSAIAKRDFGEHHEMVLAAWAQFSEGISKVIACNLDQYGPYRSGVSYPLTFTQTAAELHMPSVPWAWHAQGGIWNPIYRDTVLDHIDQSLLRLRRACAVTEHFRRGVALLDSVATQAKFPYGSEQSCQIAVARYIYCCYTTAKHVMLWNIAKRLLFALREKRDVVRIGELLAAISVKEYTEDVLASCMRAIAEKEKENVGVALACWQEDSRLGFEASMEYVFNDEFAKWKLREIDVSLTQLQQYLASPQV